MGKDCRINVRKTRAVKSKLLPLSDAVLSRIAVSVMKSVLFRRYPNDRADTRILLRASARCSFPYRYLALPVLRSH